MQEKKKYGIVLTFCLLSIIAIASCTTRRNPVTPESSAIEAKTPQTTEVETESEIKAEETTAVAEIEVEDYDPFDYVTLGNYSAISVNLLKTEITDDDVTNYITAELEGNASESEKDTASIGDTLAISYKIAIDGEISPELSKDTYEIVLGYAYLGEELDARLEGLHVDNTATAPIRLEEYYGEEYAGKTGECTATIHRIFSYAAPALSDEYLQEHTPFTTVDEYRAHVRSLLEEDAREDSRSNAKYEALQAAAKMSAFKGYPQSLYDRTRLEVDDMRTQYAKMLGMPASEVVLNVDQVIEEEVRNAILIKAIAQKEGYSVTEEDRRNYLDRNYVEYGYEYPEEMRRDYADEALDAAIINDKVMEYLLSVCTIREVAQEEYDYAAMQGDPAEEDAAKEEPDSAETPAE